MKRLVGLTAALALLLGGTAQAKPRLTFHRAKQAITIAATIVRIPPSVERCWRVSPRVIDCEIRAFVGCVGWERAEIYSTRWNYVLKTRAGYVDAWQLGEAWCN